MTDDQSKSIEKQPNGGQAPSKPPQQNNAADSQSLSKTANPSESPVKKVNVAIAGVSYPIFCPADEQQALLSAVSYINNYALDLKKEAPSLSQERVLVLCCLDLYEKMHNNQKKEEDRSKEDKQSAALLNKIMKDAQSML